MKVLDAAHVILFEAGEPLKFSEITRRMLERGLWTTAGKTPDATVHAGLAVDIKERGAASRFKRVGRATFAINGDADVAPPIVAAAETSDQRLDVADGVAPQSPTSPEFSLHVGVGRSSMTFLDAAETVLEGSSDRRPMHYRAIAAAALAKGLIQTAGRTPEATMYSQMLTETKRRVRRGEQPRFMMHGKGYVGLTKWVDHGLAYQIARHNREVRGLLLEHLKASDWAAFEELIGHLLGELGFEDVTVTSRQGDGGIDVRGTLMVGDVIRTRMAVQVKRWKANVQAPVIQQVRGSIGAHEQGLIITTSDFSKGAREEAERPDATPVGLMSGEQLVKLLVEHEIGVQRTGHDIIELALGEEEG